jgi:drug/metabolite transporter (DMT)-like permease
LPAGRLAVYLPLLLAVACVSSASIFVRLAAAPALAVAFHRLFQASVLLSPFGGKPLLVSWRTLPSSRRVAILGAGVALALHFATWIASLSYTSVASSVLLVNTAPLFSIVLTRLALREPVPRVVVSATLFAIAGAALIALGDWQASAHSLKGDLLALVGAVTLSLYHVTGRGLRAALPLNAYVLAVWGSAAATLALLSAAGRVPLVGFAPGTWAAFGALAVIPTLGGHGLMNRALRTLSAPTVGLFLLGEPIGAAILAYFIFGEVPSVTTWLGGAIVIAALALVVLRSRA